MLTVHGSNLGTKTSDLKDRVTVAGISCKIQDGGFEPSTRYLFLFFCILLFLSFFLKYCYIVISVQFAVGKPGI